MKVEIRFFARYREEAGVSRTEIDLDGKKIEDVIDSISEIFPDIEEELEKGNANLSLNGSYAELDSKIDDDDTVAIFPPVSGG